MVLGHVWNTVYYVRISTMQKSIMVKNYFTTMTLYIFLSSHENAAVVASMEMAKCLHSLHDSITFMAAVG